MKPLTTFRVLFTLIAGSPAVPARDIAPWVVVDTGQVACYDQRQSIPAPAQGRSFFGQDAHYAGPASAYRDNHDGTVTDLNTDLMWSQAAGPRKVTLAEAETIARKMTLGGHTDWRVPTIKELYSLIDFRGCTGMADPSAAAAPRNAIPYINTDYFAFRYGASDERYIDAQWLTSTKYASTTMHGAEALFGVNFADGRIKGYPIATPNPRHPEKKFYARYVRGDTSYGKNNYIDNRDGTVTDRATGLTWQQADSGAGMDWQHALAYAEGLRLAGHDDWRLPNAKELQSIVDYTRSPDTTDSPAIDPLFATTAITNEAKQKDWPFFWTSTTHLDGPDARQAVYVAFGRALGSMHGQVMDVHGAGAQRSDPKTGAARIGHGPQGDAQRVQNFVRCVRGGAVTLTPTPAKASADASKYPLTVRVAGRSYHPEKVTAPPRGARPPEAEDPHDGRSSPPGESNRGGPGPAGFVQRLDRNHDGKVSRAEFDGPSNGFDRFDRNRDGYISLDEAPAGPPPR